MVPAFNVITNAPPSDGYFRRRNPRAPTVLDTFKINLSGLGGVGVVDGVEGAGVGDVGDGVGVDGAGAGPSLLGLAVDPVEGAEGTLESFSKYQAAAKPSLPSGVRTRTH